MNDIVPGLLDRLGSEYEKRYNASKKIKRLEALLEKGQASYLDAYSYSVEVGNVRAKTFKTVLSSSVLPDGKMYYNIAERVINDTLPVDYKLSADYAVQVQSGLNSKSGLRLKAQNPKVDKSRLEGFINKLSNGQLYDDVAWILDEPVKTFTQGAVDDCVKVNTKFQSNAGVDVKCVRTSEYKCCEWCDSLAGEYSAEEVAGKSDVFTRHDNCRCTVEYQTKRLSAYSSKRGVNTFR